MKRLSMLLSAAAIATTVAIFAPASPASATRTEVCVGQGTAAVAPPGVYYPGVGQARLLGFTFNFTVGLSACTAVPGAGKLALTANGTVHGWCGLSTGHGATTNTTPEDFSWIGVGSMLILSGDLVGVVNATPNVPGGQSCATGALSFLVTGAVVKNPTSCDTGSLLGTVLCAGT